MTVFQIDMTQPRLLHFQQINAEPGKTISVASFQQAVPFDVKRVYWIHYTAESQSIVQHANKTQHQVIIPVCGTVNIELENNKGEKFTYNMSDSSTGLYVPPMHWKKLTYSKDLVLLCFSSDLYDEGDYVRNLDLFKTS